MKKMISWNTTSIIGVMFMTAIVFRFRLVSRIAISQCGRPAHYRRRPSGIMICSTRLPASATIESMRLRK